MVFCMLCVACVEDIWHMSHKAIPRESLAESGPIEIQVQPLRIDPFLGETRHLRIRFWWDVVMVRAFALLVPLLLNNHR